MKSLFLILSGLFLLSLGSCTCTQPKTDTTPVEDFSLQRYMGTWYEIARLPNWFEKGLRQVQAHYSPLNNKRILVQNSGITKAGKKKISRGEAVVVGPGHLRVSFVPPYCWFRANYKVIAINADYSQALVASDCSKYLWILARTPQLKTEQIAPLLQEAQRRGFDTSRLHWTQQEQKP